MPVAGIPTILFILYVIAFGFGLVLLPLLGRAAGGALPLMIAEPLANILVRIGMTSIGEAVLTHTAAGHYELRYPDADTSGRVPKRWERFALGRFAIGYERTKDYVGDLHWPNGSERIDAVDDIQTDGGMSAMDDELGRGERGAFVPPIARPDEKLLVLVGEAYERFKDTGGLRGLAEGENEGVEEHGGDTGGYEQRTKIVGMAIFLVGGLSVGWVVFF